MYIMNARRLLKTFIIGSSYPVMIMPLLYIGLSHLIAKVKQKKNPLDGVTHYEYFPIFLPVYYATFVLLAQTVGKRFIKNDRLRLIVFGALSGLVLSFYGRFSINYPKRVFKYVYDYPTHLEYLIHPIAFIVYAFEYGTIIYALLKLFNLL